MTRTRVVHVYGGAPYDIYIGRGRCPQTGRYGAWGNKWSHKEGTLAEFKTETVEEAVAAHKAWVLNQPQLVSRIRREMRGKTLGCWCKTKKCPDAPCHGDTFVAIADV